jgi:hypothetical protein
MDDLVRISVHDLGRELTRYQRLAQSHPVVVTSDEGAETVLLALDEYNRLKRRDRIVRAAWEFSPEELEAIRRAQLPAEAAAFDHEYQP